VRRRSRPRRQRSGRRPCRGSVPARRPAIRSRTPRPERRNRTATSPRVQSSLRQLLCREHTEGEAGVDQLGGQAFDRPDATLDHLAEAGPLSVADPRGQGVEGAAVVEVGCVHGVPGPAQLVSETEDTRREHERVMKQHDFGHRGLPLTRCCGDHFKRRRGQHPRRWEPSVTCMSSPCWAGRIVERCCCGRPGSPRHRTSRGISPIALTDK
jgi:hypothetical protein